MESPVLLLFEVCASANSEMRVLTSHCPNNVAGGSVSVLDSAAVAGVDQAGNLTIEFMCYDAKHLISDSQIMKKDE